MLNPDTGEWSCPLCYALVGRDNEEDEELFDDDEEAAFDNDEDYTAEEESASKTKRTKKNPSHPIPSNRRHHRYTRRH